MTALGESGHWPMLVGPFVTLRLRDAQIEMRRRTVSACNTVPLPSPISEDFRIISVPRKTPLKKVA